MKNRPFYFEIKNLITQFIGAFNDIAIKRYDKDRADSGETVGVGFMYAPKQRVIEDILNASRAIALPTISINIANISRDAERVFNKIDGHYITTAATSDGARKIPQPVPINVTVNMSIVARYQADIEQIISNFVPYCDPYIVVSWKLPTTEGTTYEREIRTIIEWNGTLNMQYPIELSNSQLARVTCDTSFTIKGWLFKQIDESTGKVYTINSSNYSSLLGEECVVFNNNTNAASYDSNAPEIFTIHARPFTTGINNSSLYINRTPADYNYIVYGTNLQYTTGLYLKTKGSSVFDTTTRFDLFHDTPEADKYLAFNGKQITNFTVNDKNSINFTMPAGIVRAGYMDVVVVNAAGLSLLSQDCYIAGVDSTFQPACVSGIKVEII